MNDKTKPMAQTTPPTATQVSTAERNSASGISPYADQTAMFATKKMATIANSLLRADLEGTLTG